MKWACVLTFFFLSDSCPSRELLHIHEMSRQGTLTAAVATLLGATIGGLFLWRSIYAQKKKALRIPKDTHPLPVEQVRPLELNSTAVRHPQQELTPPLAQTPKYLSLPSIEKLLEVPAVVVSSCEEFEEHWPLFQKDLLALPILGLDCEWVKSMHVRVTPSRIQIRCC